MIKAKHTTIVKRVLEVDWHSDVANYVARKFMIGQDLRQSIPTVFDGIKFEKVVPNHAKSAQLDKEIEAQSTGNWHLGDLRESTMSAGAPSGPPVYQGHLQR